MGDTNRAAANVGQSSAKTSIKPTIKPAVKPTIKQAVKPSIKTSVKAQTKPSSKPSPKISSKTPSKKPDTKTQTNGISHKPSLSLGQRAADSIARIGGSWTFIFIFLGFLVLWMVINSVILAKFKNPFDAYPYILLNLVLSCIAAIQAPVILMSQNRAAERDRIRAERDYAVNRKAERENQMMMQDLNQIKNLIKKMTPKNRF